MITSDKINLTDLITGYIYNQNVQFTIEEEINRSLAFLDVNLTYEENKIQTTVYRKPTANLAILSSKVNTSHTYKHTAFNMYILTEPCTYVRLQNY